MAIKDKLTEEFLKALNEIEIVLLTLFFKRHSFFKKGLAYYIEYIKQNNTRVEFLFGPSDWDIEMIIYTSKGKFAFKDLLNISEINRWVNDNRYKQGKGRNVKNELLWYVDLLKVSLPYVE
jgi:hypothetical protein